MEHGLASGGEGAVTAPAPAEIGHEPAIGKIERVPLREVWRHEAYNLTTWLEGNIDVLNDALDVNLSNVEREHLAGSFSVDLIAEDESGGIAVIENQLERSNHDHPRQADHVYRVHRGADGDLDRV